MSTLAFFIPIALSLTAATFAQGDLDSLRGVDNARKAMKFYQSGRFDSAATLFYSASKSFQKGGYYDSTIRSLNNSADAYIRAMRLDLAQDRLREAENVGQRFPLSRGLPLSQTYTLLGYIFTYNDLADSAIRVIERGLQIRRESLGRDHPSVAASLYTLGLALKKKGNYEESIDDFNEALRIHRAQGVIDTMALANTLMMLGTVRIAESRFVSAKRDLEEAQHWLIRYSAATRESIASFNYYLGMTNSGLGEFSEAVRSYNSALRMNLLISGEENPAVASIFVKLGDVYNSQGEFQQAIRYYQKGLAISTRLVGAAHSGVGEIYARIADAYLVGGEIDMSLKFALKALETKKIALGARHPEIILGCENVGDIYIQCRRYRKALEQYRMALDIQGRLNNASSTVVSGRILSKIGHVFQLTGHSDSANIFLTSGIQILTNCVDANPHDRATAREWMGNFFYQVHEYSLAIKTYEAAIACLSHPQAAASNSNTRLAGWGFAEDLIRIVAEKAEAQASAGEPFKTFETCRSAWGVIDSLRRQFTSDRSKLKLGEQTRSLYDIAVDACLQRFRANADSVRLEELFDTVERGKMNVLIDAVQEARAASFVGVPQSLIIEEREIETRLAYFEERLDLESRNGRPRDSAQIAFYRDRLFESYMHRQQLVDSLSGAYPEYASMRFGSERPTLESIRLTLDPGTWFVEYCLTEKNIVTLLIGRDSVLVLSAPKPHGLGALVNEYCRKVRTLDDEGVKRTGVRLSKMLLSPKLSRCNSWNRLIIAPDGPLFYLPFEALYLGRNGRIDSQLLIQKCEVRYTYSAAFFWNLHTRAEPGLPRGASFLGFAPMSPTKSPNVWDTPGSRNIRSETGTRSLPE